LDIYANVFRSDDVTSEQPCGLMLFDVFNLCSVHGNTFYANEGSIGLGIVSGRRGIAISENVFYGTPFAIDFVERPFYSSDITFFNNIGANDFFYDEGTFYANSAIY
jgi:hypothetical protein